jgi:hypothetical protein
MTKKPSLTPVDLASMGQYRKIDFAKLTPSEITKYDDMGYTLLHHIARHGRWELLPKHLQDKKYWKESQDGDTILISAFYGDDQSWINKEDLTEEEILKTNATGEFIAHMAVKQKRLYTIPNPSITERVLTKKLTESHQPTASIEARGGDMLIHEIAKLDQIHIISKPLLTEDLLSQKGTWGDSVYHLVAPEPQANSIPKKLWTLNAMRLRNDQLLTPLHGITQHNDHLVPSDISLKDLLMRSKSGDTPLHSWARGNGWINIPEKFIDGKTLNIKGPRNTTPLELIISNFKDKLTSKKPEDIKIMKTKLKIILSKSDKQSLMTLRKETHHETSKLIKDEIAKRSILNNLSNKEKSFEI